MPPASPRSIPRLVPHPAPRVSSRHYYLLNWLLITGPAGLGKGCSRRRGRPKPGEQGGGVGKRMAGSTCPQCRAAIENGDRFCRHCGTGLSGDASPGLTTDTPSNPWRALFDLSPDALALVDEQGRIVLANA